MSQRPDRLLDMALHVRGESRFVDDLAPPAGTLHAAVFASPAAHGRIRRLDLSHACTQTQGISGLISQCPSGRTPPQGPLRRFLGQVIGQVIPVLCRMHCPHIWQSKMAPLLSFSTWIKSRSPGESGVSQRWNGLRAVKVAS